MPDLKLLQRPQRIGLGLYFIAHRPEICPQRIQYILIIIQDHQCISIFLFSSFVFAHLFILFFVTYSPSIGIAA